MKRIVLAAALLAGAATPGEAQDARSSLRLLAGLREFDDDFEPVEDQTAFGLEWDLYDPAWPLGFEVGISYSEEDDTETILGMDVDLTVKASEAYAGARKTWSALSSGALHPYLSGGVSVMNAEVEADAAGASGEEDDTAFGLYVRGGAYWNLTERLHVGADVRQTFGTEFEIEDVDIDGDYLQLSGFIGFTF